MGLLGNQLLTNCFGAGFAWGGPYGSMGQMAWEGGQQHWNWIRQDLASTALQTHAGPTGGYPPAAWWMAVKAGELASTAGRVEGSGTVTDGNLAGGLNGVAALVGDGTITAAALQLVVSAVAALTGTGALAGDIIGKLEAVAALSGSGDLTAALGALAGLASALSGSAAVAGVLDAKGWATSDITVSGTILSGNVQALAEAVWNALAANYNDAGTMGEKMNDAGGAGNPWTEVIETGYTAKEVLRVMAAVLAGKSTVTDLGGGNATVVFRNLPDTKDRVTADMSVTSRTTVTTDTA